RDPCRDRGRGGGAARPAGGQRPAADRGRGGLAALGLLPGPLPGPPAPPGEDGLLLRTPVANLLKVDPAFRDIVAAAPDFEVHGRRQGDYFNALVRAIVYQQLAGRAAAAIHGRFLAVFEIGRASCRERVWRSGGGVAVVV